MDWERLLKLERLNDSNYIQKKHRPTYMQDADRILFSLPFRRLANKTQVHPLYDNDHIHHRLIHSLEVVNVGRSLGIEVGAWLADERREIPEDQVQVMAGLVQTACMAHDIGNPPFGHSGEDAIGSWCRERFLKPEGIFQDIDERARDEFEAFEGNAQGFRILTRTEMYKEEGGMRLALGSLGAFTKYPTSAFVKKHVGVPYVGTKKYGFFENDTATFERVADGVGLPRREVTVDGVAVGYCWRRHPLAFLMEAADDICYNVMDLEDAFIAGGIDFETVKSLLSGLLPPSNKEYSGQTNADVVSRYRAQAINGAISACIEAFKDNYDAIMSGEFAISLIEASRLAAKFKTIKAFSEERIFSAMRKTELEIYGRNVVYRVLDGLVPLVNEYRAKGWDFEKLGSYHAQLARVLEFRPVSARNSYDAMHALTDFVSGMTDRYAVKIADMIGRR